MELSSPSPMPTDSDGLQDVKNESKLDYFADPDAAEINYNKSSNSESISTSFADPLKLSANLEYLMSSTEDDENESSSTMEKLANDSSLILNETVNVHTVVSCLPNESLGIILGMNERIDHDEREKREIYMKKIVPNGAVHRIVMESQSFTLGDEILAINGSYFEKMTRSECIELFTNLPSDVSFISRRNSMPWTAGPRCSFYLNLIDSNRENILTPAPKLFTNEGKRIPDNYKLLEVSLYREIGDQLGISLVISYGDTNHYYQIKSLDPEGLCSKSKLLNPGDCLVSCNCNSLYKIPFNQCLNIINSEGPSLTFEILRKDAIAADENIESEANINQETKINSNNNNNTWDPELELENRNIEDKPKEFDENEDLLISFKDLSTEDSEPPSLDLLNNASVDVALLQESASKSYVEQSLTSQTTPVKSSTEVISLDPIDTPNLPIEIQDSAAVCSEGPEDKNLIQSIVEDTCVQKITVSEHSSVTNNSGGQVNMSEYKNSKEEVSSNGSDDSLISNELNNNINNIYPCYSNEDLISLGFDSPPPHKADLTFQSTILAPREAAGESKSDLNDIYIDPFLDQQDNYRSEHNLNKFNTNTVGFPISHHRQVNITNNSGDLLDFQSNNNQKILSSYNELLDDELESPFSTDGSLPSSFGAQVVDEDGDIHTHLSLMHSQNDGSEENSVMTPDSGRPDSPRIQKNSSLNTLKISHKRDIASPNSNMSDDFKSEDESSTAYHDVKTDEDDTTTYQDLSELSTELGDKLQKSNHSDFFESADSCRTSESSFDMCNDGDQESDQFTKPLKNTFSQVHLKSRETKSLPRNMTSNYMPRSFEDNQLKSLNKYAIDTSLLKNVSENILPTSNTMNNQEKLVLSKRLFLSTNKQDRKSNNRTRSEDRPFRVEVLKGILGLGMNLKVDENGFAKVSDIKSQSTIGKNGNIKVGDYILSINNTDLLNVTDSRVQQILRVLPRGLITVVASVSPVTNWKHYFVDSPLESVPSSLSSLEINPVIIPSSPKIVSINSCFSEKQPPIIHNMENDNHNTVPSSPNRTTSWNSEPSNKKMSSSPSSATKTSDFTQKDAIEDDLCCRMMVKKDKHSIQNGRTSPQSFPLVDLSNLSPDTSKDKTSFVLTSSMPHVAVEPLKYHNKKQSNQSSVVSLDQFESPLRNLEMQPSNSMQIPVKNESNMEWSTNLPSTFESTSPVTPTNSSLISITTESHIAPLEFVQKEESVSSYFMPPSFSVSKSQKTETDSSPLVTPANEPPISPRMTSCRKLPDIFKSSRTNAPVVGQITSLTASEIMFTDFAQVTSPNVIPVVESVIDIQKYKHNFAESPKVETVMLEPIVMQPKLTENVSESLVKTSSIHSPQVTKPKDDVSQNRVRTPSMAKADTFQLKADNGIPESGRQRTSLKRETLESVTQVDSSRKGTEKTTSDNFKDNLSSEGPKKLIENVPTSPTFSYKAEVIQNSNQSPDTTEDVSVTLRKNRGRSEISPTLYKTRSELISEKALIFSQGSKSSDSISRQTSIQRRKEITKTCLDPHIVFSKRKWCISTKFGQTNFAIPSEPESAQDVLKLSLLDEDTVVDLVDKGNFALDKLGFSDHYSIHICIVEKNASEKIGMRLQKGEKQELLISLLEPEGAAMQHQYICEGDLLLYMDGKPAWNQNVMDMKILLNTIATRIIILLARPFVGEDSETFEITLYKGVTGLGFSLGGGIGCPLGDRPISVKRIFKGGSADRGGEMKVGDEILEVNGESFRNQRHFNAWNHLKFLPEGELKLLICRHRSNERMEARTAISRQASSSSSSSSATGGEVISSTTTTSVELRKPAATPEEPAALLLPLSPEKASSGIAAAAARIAMSTVGAIAGPHQSQKSTTTTNNTTT